ncbi:depupylase/deamidase Dop [Corynebacterium aquilae]|uniref:depupylase/deamidase Dop n=1 Tax=Corynebacterium aquilae TaxID=203263 RepID=UPI000952C63A|nr:depupylase/deamidase Dop [Corynebacterium aquilae]
MGRILGTETEYGIATPGDAFASPIITSTHVVVGYALDSVAHATRGTQWDFAGESPLKDSRGFDLRRYHSTPVVAADGIGVANMVLGNGARFYVDHAHPEYSAPETTSAFDAMVYDQAGDRIMWEAAEVCGRRSARGESALEGHPPCPELKIYKNNVDGKGASYGSHENYQYSRETDFSCLAAGLIPFFVTRQIFCGAGRVGLGTHSQEAGFQISQRADYIEQEISLETTLNRGIINTRDEPHADKDRFGRLHVIIGDANMSQFSNLLKLGTSELVISAIESGVDFSDLSLARPVDAVRVVSRDLEVKTPLLLADGRARTAIEIQREYAARVKADSPEARRIVELWVEVLDKLERDPLSTADMLDWTAKLSLLNRYHAQGVAWDDPKMQLVDLQYADLDPTKGLYYALVRRGLMRTVVAEDEIVRAMRQAPSSTRAALRGGLMRCVADRVVSANWDSVILRDDDGELVRLALGDGVDLPSELVALFDTADDCVSVGEVIAAFTRLRPQWVTVLGS